MSCQAGACSRWFCYYCADIYACRSTRLVHFCCLRILVMMRFILDLAPWLAFAIGFWLTRDIYTATVVLIPATFVQVGALWLLYRRLEQIHLITLVAAVVFGGATLLLHESRFIQWKPTVVNALLALVFAISAFWSPTNPLPKRLLGSKVQLPQTVWMRLTWMWVVFFIFSGSINLAVAYMYSEEVWVNFKLFGQMAITILFVIGQTVYMASHMSKRLPQEKNHL